MSAPRVLLVSLILAPLAPAQLTDLQPGRNYQNATVNFGAGHSESIDAGDVDNDGDFDVAVANGGDSGPQANTLWINQGGHQSGEVGAFVDGTATRFAGLPLDTSRDLDFVDLESDGDLDIVVANRGTVVNGGEVSRAYRNLGGQQQGNVGFFEESTDSFWGQLIGVPASAEVGVVDGQGPFRGYSCDCDFGDVNDDGHLDLFYSAYGPNLNGSHDSRIFLNDGLGRFDELWPWADPGADIRLHTLDVELLDIDGDFDLDVFGSSRDSQARVYRNNLYGGAGSGSAFDDVTQSALLDTGATASGLNNYETEFGDLDGDGDFDMVMLNYSGFSDRILVNDGAGVFTAQQGWIAGDPSVDENELDLLDYDGDGDLDLFAANFSGTNFLYASGLAQGLDPDTDGLLHRTGTSVGGSQADFPETPAANNGGTTRDADCFDLDNDGDTDIVLANDNNQDNRRWRNNLGVPDSHAPEFANLTVVEDKSDGSETVIHAVLRDNASYQIVGFHDVRLVYRSGGAPTCVAMTHQGGMQFRGVIPASVNGFVRWRVEATDHTGNTGISQTFGYTQTSTSVDVWTPLGCGTASAWGTPQLRGQGEPVQGGDVRLVLTDAAPDAQVWLTLGAHSTPAPFHGGTLYTAPVDAVLVTQTDGGGLLWLELPWHASTPSGFELTWQAIVRDTSAPSFVTLSNAVTSTTP